jgi:hypothetical protein
LNVTDTWQFPLAEIDEPHESATMLNGAAALIDAIPRATMFGLVIVTVLAPDTVPTATLPNASETGENVGFERTPVPVSATAWGLPAASSEIVKLPLRVPVCVGLNVVPIVQLAAGARSLPLHVSLLITKSPEGTTASIWRATVLGFLRVVVFVVLEAPTITLPKLQVSGVIVSLPATPAPFRAADPALGFASSLNDSNAVRVPSAAGVKVSITVQLVPLARVEPQPWFVMLNSLGSEPLS